MYSLFLLDKEVSSSSPGSLKRPAPTSSTRVSIVSGLVCEHKLLWFETESLDHIQVSKVLVALERLNSEL